MNDVLRRLRRAPGFAISVILTLALGIGTAVAMFTIVNAVLFAALPYPEPEQLTRWIAIYPDAPPGFNLSFPNFEDVRDRARSFSVASSYRPWEPTLTGAGAPDVLRGVLVSRGFQVVLGVPPLYGRYFESGESVDGRDDVVALGHAFWTHRFGADATVIGRTVTLNGRPHVVVAVMPATFGVGLPGLHSVDVWRPEGEVGADMPGRGTSAFRVIARLRSGVTLGAAQAELASISAALAIEHPDTNSHEAVGAQALHDAVVGSVRRSLMILLGAAGVLFVLALANVAQLMLGWLTARSRELAIRLALGASRRRLVILLAGDAGVLSLAGGALGIGLATVLTRVFVLWSGESIPLAPRAGIDLRVAAALLGCTMASTAALVIVGRRPVLGGSRVETLRMRSGRGRGARVRGLLVVTGVALSLVLLAGAALLTRSLSGLTAVNPGFETDVATFRVSPPATRYPTIAEIKLFYDRLIEQLRATPGVTHVASVGAAPFSGASLCGQLYAEDDPSFGGRDECAEVRPVTPGYFEVLRIPVVQGRAFSSADREGSPEVVIVGEATAKALWPGESPIGKRLFTGLGGRMHEVVGVVPDIKQFALSEPTVFETYLPAAQWVRRTQTLVVRGSRAAVDLIPDIREAVRMIDPDVPIRDASTLGALVERSTTPQLLALRIIALYSTLAAILAAIGVYGIVSYWVTDQRSTLAVRLALGASPQSIFALVIGRGLRLTALGVVAGLVLAFAGTRVLAALLFEVSPWDYTAFSAAVFLVLVMAAVASALPARRAARTDPLVAMQAE